MNVCVCYCLLDALKANQNSTKIGLRVSELCEDVIVRLKLNRFFYSIRRLANFVKKCYFPFLGRATRAGARQNRLQLSPAPLRGVSAPSYLAGWLSVANTIFFRAHNPNTIFVPTHLQ